MGATFNSCIAAVLLATASVPIGAQEQNHERNDSAEILADYLSQPAPRSDRLVKFAPGVISTNEAWEEKLTFTPDMQQAFFARHPNEDYFKPELLSLDRHGSDWTGPQKAYFTGEQLIGFPLVDPTGQRLYMERVAGQIVFSEKKASGWSNPREWTPNAKGVSGFGLAQRTNSGNLYFYSRYERIVYVQRWNGESYNGPEALPMQINPAVEFFVARDESYLIFTPIDWDNPVHISFNMDGEWSLPISLQKHFKGWNARGYGPYVSPDERYFFIGNKGDIFWSTTDFIDALRDQRLSERTASIKQ